MVRVAINGYGRIGRVAHRVILDRFGKDIEVVAINAGSSTDLTGWMHLLHFDTNYGTLQNHTLSIKSPEQISVPFQTTAKLLGALTIDGKDILIFSEKDPLNLPWKDLTIDTVIESTGKLAKEEDITKHITAGAKSVILSAPFKDEGAGATYVLGVNLEANATGLPTIISNASCTTNCITPVAHVIENSFGIEKAMMTTIHGYTSDQRLLDGGHKDYRRARSAAQNIIPTSTGATKAVGVAIPALKGIFSGLAIRVPISVGSLSDCTFIVKKATTVEEVNKALIEAATGPLKGILETTTDPVVSSDIIGNPHSSIADLSLTQVVGGTMVKIIAWYDNEYGYANRLIEETLILGKNIQASPTQ